MKLIARPTKNGEYHIYRTMRINGEHEEIYQETVKDPKPLGAKIMPSLALNLPLFSRYRSGEEIARERFLDRE
jgi:hypothetical protein